MKKQQTKRKTKKDIESEKYISEADEALKKLESSNKNITTLNEAVKNKDYNELVDFVIRLSANSKDLQNMFRLLARLQEQPQSFRGDNEFSTIYNVAKLDGEREIVRKFANLTALAMDGNRLEIEKELTRNPFL